MAIRCWPELVKYGARQQLENRLGKYILAESETESEFDVSLSIDLEALPTTPGAFTQLRRSVRASLTCRGKDSADLDTGSLQAYCHVGTILDCV